MKTKAFLAALLFCISCGENPAKDKNIPIIGFIDFVEDETLALAKQGFYDALKSKHFSEDSNTVKIIYRNAQGDQPTLVQACDYMISENVALLATNTTLSTISAVQRTKTIPVCMMVAPRPDLAKLTNNKGEAPANLFGVYESLEYIDTAASLVKQLLPTAKVLGLIYNQAEPQSVDALNVVRKAAERSGLRVEALPVNNSAETQTVTEALLAKKIDAFFALPDNVIFASFETVVKSCDKASVPIFTSEIGLVKRGALAAYGADMYQWGFQAGLQAALYLETKDLNKLKPVEVIERNRVINSQKASIYKLMAPATYKTL